MESQCRLNTLAVFPHTHTCRLGTLPVQQVLFYKNKTFHFQQFHPEKYNFLCFVFFSCLVTLISCLLGLFAGSKLIGNVAFVPSFISDHLSFLSLIKNQFEELYPSRPGTGQQSVVLLISLKSSYFCHLTICFYLAQYVLVW